MHIALAQLHLFIMKIQNYYTSSVKYTFSFKISVGGYIVIYIPNYVLLRASKYLVVRPVIGSSFVITYLYGKFVHIQLDSVL
jgi:hypothetical protein